MPSIFDDPNVDVSLKKKTIFDTDISTPSSQEETFGGLPSTTFSSPEETYSYVRSGIAEGFFDFSKEDIPFAGGVFEGTRYLNLANIANKVNKGDPLSEKESLDLKLGLKELEDSENQDWTYTAGETIRGSLTFAAELGASALLVATGVGAPAGAGGLAASASAKAAKKTGLSLLKKMSKEIIKKGVKKSITKSLYRTASKKFGKRVARAITKSSFLGAVALADNLVTSDNIYAGTQRRKMQAVFSGNDPEAVSAFSNALADNVIENLSERSGFLIGKVGAKFIPEKIKKSVVLSSIGRFMNANPGKDAKYLGDIFRSVGVNGILEEMGEERLGGFLRGLYGVDGEASLARAFDLAIPTAEQMKIEGTAFSIPGVVRSSMYASISPAVKKFKQRVRNKKLKERVDNYTFSDDSDDSFYANYHAWSMGEDQSLQKDELYNLIEEKKHRDARLELNKGALAVEKMAYHPPVRHHVTLDRDQTERKIKTDLLQDDHFKDIQLYEQSILDDEMPDTKGELWRVFDDDFKVGKKYTEAEVGTAINNRLKTYDAFVATLNRVRADNPIIHARSDEVIGDGSLLDQSQRRNIRDISSVADMTYNDVIAQDKLTYNENVSQIQALATENERIVAKEDLSNNYLLHSSKAKHDYIDSLKNKKPIIESSPIAEAPIAEAPIAEAPIVEEQPVIINNLTSDEEVKAKEIANETDIAAKESGVEVDLEAIADNSFHRDNSKKDDTVWFREKVKNIISEGKAKEKSDIAIIEKINQIKLFNLDKKDADKIKTEEIKGVLHFTGKEEVKPSTDIPANDKEKLKIKEPELKHQMIEVEGDIAQKLLATDKANLVSAYKAISKNLDSRFKGQPELKIVKERLRNNIRRFFSRFEPHEVDLINSILDGASILDAETFEKSINLRAFFIDNKMFEIKTIDNLKGFMFADVQKNHFDESELNPEIKFMEESLPNVDPVVIIRSAKNNSLEDFEILIRKYLTDANAINEFDLKKFKNTMASQYSISVFSLHDNKRFEDHYVVKYKEEYVNPYRLGKKYIIFDLETTGLHNKTSDIFQISYHIIEDEGKTDTKKTIELKVDNLELLLKHSPVITNESLIKHYIESSKKADNDAIIKEIIDVFGNSDENTFLVGHNIKEFDLDFLSEKTKIDFSKTNVIDTLDLAKISFPEPNLKLTTLGAAFGMDISGAHDAGKDVSITKHVFEGLHNIDSTSSVKKGRSKFLTSVLSRKNKNDLISTFDHAFHLNSEVAKEDMSVKDVFVEVGLWHNYRLATIANDSAINPIIKGTSFRDWFFDNKTAIYKSIDTNSSEHSMVFDDYKNQKSSSFRRLNGIITSEKDAENYALLDQNMLKLTANEKSLFQERFKLFYHSILTGDSKYYYLMSPVRSYGLMRYDSLGGVTERTILGSLNKKADYEALASSPEGRWIHQVLFPNSNYKDENEKKIAAAYLVQFKKLLEVGYKKDRAILGEKVAEKQIIARIQHIASPRITGYEKSDEIDNTYIVKHYTLTAEDIKTLNDPELFGSIDGARFVTRDFMGRLARAMGLNGGVAPISLKNIHTEMKPDGNQYIDKAMDQNIDDLIDEVARDGDEKKLAVLEKIRKIMDNPDKPNQMIMVSINIDGKSSANKLNPTGSNEVELSLSKLGFQEESYLGGREEDVILYTQLISNFIADESFGKYLDELYQRTSKEIKAVNLEKELSPESRSIFKEMITNKSILDMIYQHPNMKGDFISQDHIKNEVLAFLAKKLQPKIKSTKTRTMASFGLDLKPTRIINGKLHAGQVILFAPHLREDELFESKKAALDSMRNEHVHVRAIKVANAKYRVKIKGLLETINFLYQERVADSDQYILLQNKIDELTALRDDSNFEDFNTSFEESLMLLNIIAAQNEIKTEHVQNKSESRDLLNELKKLKQDFEEAKDANNYVLKKYSYDDIEEDEIIEHEDGTATIPGALILSNRLPSDDWHQHSPVRLKRSLQTESNAIYINSSDDVLSGGDKDGDQRFNITGKIAKLAWDAIRKNPKRFLSPTDARKFDDIFDTVLKDKNSELLPSSVKKITGINNTHNAWKAMLMGQEGSMGILSSIQSKFKLMHAGGSFEHLSEERFEEIVDVIGTFMQISVDNAKNLTAIDYKLHDGYINYIIYRLTYSKAKNIKDALIDIYDDLYNNEEFQKFEADYFRSGSFKAISNLDRESALRADLEAARDFLKPVELSYAIMTNKVRNFDDTLMPLSKNIKDIDQTTSLGKATYTLFKKLYELLPDVIEWNVEKDNRDHGYYGKRTAYLRDILTSKYLFMMNAHFMPQSNVALASANHTINQFQRDFPSAFEFPRYIPSEVEITRFATAFNDLNALNQRALWAYVVKTQRRKGYHKFSGGLFNLFPDKFQKAMFAEMNKLMPDTLKNTSSWTSHRIENAVFDPFFFTMMANFSSSPEIVVMPQEYDKQGNKIDGVSFYNAEADVIQLRKDYTQAELVHELLHSTFVYQFEKNKSFKILVNNMADHVFLRTGKEMSYEDKMEMVVEMLVSDAVVRRSAEAKALGIDIQENRDILSKYKLLFRLRLGKYVNSLKKYFRSFFPYLFGNENKPAFDVLVFELQKYISRGSQAEVRKALNNRFKKKALLFNKPKEKKEVSTIKYEDSLEVARIMSSNYPGDLSSDNKFALELEKLLNDTDFIDAKSTATAQSIETELKAEFGEEDYKNVMLEIAKAVQIDTKIGDVKKDKYVDKYKNFIRDFLNSLSLSQNEKDLINIQINRITGLDGINKRLSFILGKEVHFSEKDARKEFRRWFPEDDFDKLLAGDVSIHTMVKNAMFYATRLKATRKLSIAMKASGFSSDKPLNGYSKVNSALFYNWKVSKAKNENAFPAGNGFFARKTDIYVQDKYAKVLNQIYEPSKFKGMPFFDFLTTITNITKLVLLQGGFFHDKAFVLSFVLGGAGNSLKGLNFIPRFQEGLDIYKIAFSDEFKNLDDMTDKEKQLFNRGMLLKALFEGGLTSFSKEEYDESVYFDNFLARQMNNYRFTRFIKKWSKKRSKFLFGSLGAGLKYMAAVQELEKGLKELKIGEDPRELISSVAALINADFGGINQARERKMFGIQGLDRTQTRQHIFKLLALAPDWTESNWLMFDKALKSSKPVEKRLAKAFVSRILFRYMVFASFASLALGLVPDSGGDNDEEYMERLIRRFNEAWNSGNLAWMQTDVTPLMEAIGMTPGSKAYFNGAGHFMDYLKLIPDPTSNSLFEKPINFAKHKTSVPAKMFLGLITGQNSFGNEFTTADRLAKTGRLTEFNKSKSIISTKNRLSQLFSYLAIQSSNAMPIALKTAYGTVSFDTDYDRKLKLFSDLIALNIRVKKKRGTEIDTQGVFGKVFDAMRDMNPEFAKPATVVKVGKMDIDPSLLNKNASFALDFDKDSQLPRWTAERLTAESIRGSSDIKRPKKFKVDVGDVTHRDYSPYTNIDRGHIAAAGNYNTKKTKDATFYMSNVAPQDSKFNQKKWAELEGWTRDLTINGPVEVYTGPILDDFYLQKIHGDGTVTVPRRFYKVIVQGNKAIGFIMENKELKGNLRDYAVSVDKVERLTNIDFLTNADESSVGYSNWNWVPHRFLRK